MVFSIKLAYQYHDLKKAASDCLLLMQVGAFMKVMDEDARASCRRLIQAIRERFGWLDEYFCWESGKPELRYPTPSPTLRFSHQQQSFVDCLPGHVT